MFGSWKIEVNTNGMPQKVATAFSKLSETMLGVEYEMIAYLGSQVANGTNHAVLAEQILVTGRDVRNIVVVIFNEKPGEMECSLVAIERLVEEGLAMGGIHVDVKKKDEDIPAEAMEAWNAAFEELIGSYVDIVAYLGSQAVKGTNYIFAATMTPVVPNGQSKFVLVTVNPMTGSIAFANPLANKQEASLGYSFTWLKGGLGKPLGEWP